MAKPPYQSDYRRLISSLRNARRDVGLDQSELASRLGVSQAFISNYERGAKTINVVEFVRICHALQLDPCNQISILSETPEAS